LSKDLKYVEQLSINYARDEYSREEKNNCRSAKVKQCLVKRWERSRKLLNPKDIEEG
jgi:hypothetical protein